MDQRESKETFWVIFDPKGKENEKEQPAVINFVDRKNILLE